MLLPALRFDVPIEDDEPLPADAGGRRAAWPAAPAPAPPDPVDDGTVTTASRAASAVRLPEVLAALGFQKMR